MFKKRSLEETTEGEGSNNVSKFFSKKYKLLLTLIVILPWMILSPAYAAKKTAIIPLPVQTSLVVDGKTGKILHDVNSKVQIYPASLTKLMTLYLLFESLSCGKLKLTQKFHVSGKATKMPPSKLWVKENDFITVKDCIFALSIKSANDVAVVVAENMRGSEKNFAKLMTLRAKQLGMRDTNFMNASGLHHPNQKTTARDLVKLALALKRDHYKFYPLFSKTSFVFKGDLITSHNRVNREYQGAEGLKTGYTTPAGYNLITAATRNRKSLVGVVTGSRSAISRDQQMMKMLDMHFGATRKPFFPTNKLMANKTTTTLKTITSLKSKPVVKSQLMLASAKVAPKSTSNITENKKVKPTTELKKSIKNLRDAKKITTNHTLKSMPNEHKLNKVVSNNLVDKDKKRIIKQKTI